MFDLAGRRAYVPGGLGLIGRAICDGLEAAGAEVIALEPEGAPASAHGTKAIAFDVTAPDLDRRYRVLEAQHGPADILVNAAYPRTADWGQIRLANQAEDSWRRNVDLQLNSTCLLASHAAAAMAGRGGGSIVNLASIYGVVGPDFSVYEGTDLGTPPAYSAVKAGLIGFTRYLASHYGPQGVRVNAVAPGGVASAQPDRFVEAYNARTPLRRMARAEEVAGPVVFLASDAASYVTGAVLMVDGGWTAI